MIKPQELRKGNLISDGHITYTVQGFYEDYTNTWNVYVNNEHLGQTWNSLQELNNFTPIELTEEWLVKMGFTRREPVRRNGNGYDYKPEDVYTIYTDYILENFVYRKSIWYYKGIEENEDIAIWWDNNLCKCSYIHQLQNLYFALSGKELEIKNTKLETSSPCK